MPTNFYDLIVIGDEPSGLVAATLCARRGMRVLLARTGRRPARYKVGPYDLPTAPLTLAGLTSPAAKRVFDELHFHHPLKRRLRDSQPAFQLAGPDLRLDVVPDDVDFARELARELGDEGGALELCERAGGLSRLLDPMFAQDIAVPPTGFWERREIGRAAGKLAEDGARWREEADADPRVRALTSLPAVLGGYLSPDSLTPEARARSFDQWRKGAPRVRGDWEALGEMFGDKFSAQSGEVREVKIDELLLGWKGASGVRLDDGEELGAQHLIAAMPIEELIPMLGKKQPKRLLQLAESITTVGYRYTLNLVLAEAGIPEGMGASVFAVGDFEAPLEGANALAIYVGEPDDQARVVVTVQAICPAPGDDTPLEQAFSTLRGDIRRALEDVMPFVSRHLLLVHSPNEPPAKGHEIELGQPIPAPAIWRYHEEGPLGISALPYQVGVKQLTLASTQTLPGLGLEGELVAGWCAAKLACAATGKKEYLRDEVFAGAS
jgi:phytoene dehydrogenase-like protein